MITGAGRGLGSVLAAAFDAAGAELALVARSKPALEGVASQLTGDHLVCAGDVRDELFNETVAERMTERFGGVDVWIANAGVSREDPDITRLSPAAWREVIDVNLTGTFLGARAAAARMGAGGRIIVTGSCSATGRMAASPPTRRPKAASMPWSGRWRRNSDHGRSPPTPWRSAGSRPGSAPSGSATSAASGTSRRTPPSAARGTAADLPGVYLFLASAASAYITGTTITVDGGYSLL